MAHLSRKEVYDRARKAMKAVRKRLGLNCSRFARHISIPHQTVWRYENAVYRPNQELLIALCNLDPRQATQEELEAFRIARDFDEIHGLAAE